MAKRSVSSVPERTPMRATRTPCRGILPVRRNSRKPIELATLPGHESWRRRRFSYEARMPETTARKDAPTGDWISFLTRDNR